MQLFGARRDKDSKRGSFGTNHTSDKYGGQLASVSSPKHNADTGYESPPKTLPVIGSEVTDSSLWSTHIGCPKMSISVESLFLVMLSR